MRDIRDGVVVARSVRPTRQHRLEHGKSALRFRIEPRDSVRNLLGSLPFEEARLPERRTDAGNVKEKLLEHASATFEIHRDQTACLLGRSGAAVTGGASMNEAVRAGADTLGRRRWINRGTEPGRQRGARAFFREWKLGPVPRVSCLH